MKPLDFNYPVAVPLVNFAKAGLIPFAGVWEDYPISLSVLDSKIQKNDLNPFSFSDFNQSQYHGLGCYDHEGRIAHFVVGGVDLPIEVDISCSGVHALDWPVSDGNHRLAGAYIRGDFEILCNFSGDVDLIEQFIATGDWGEFRLSYEPYPDFFDMNSEFFRAFW